MFVLARRHGVTRPGKGGERPEEWDWNGAENGVALNVGAFALALEMEDGDAVAGGNAQRLAGAARGLAVGGPAQHEFRGAIERGAQHLDYVAGVERLDEAREPGKGRMGCGGDGALPCPKSVAAGLGEGQGRCGGAGRVGRAREPRAGRAAVTGPACDSPRERREECRGKGEPW